MKEWLWKVWSSLKVLDSLVLSYVDQFIESLLKILGNEIIKSLNKEGIHLQLVPEIRIGPMKVRNKRIYFKEYIIGGNIYTMYLYHDMSKKIADLWFCNGKLWDDVTNNGLATANEIMLKVGDFTWKILKYIPIKKIYIRWNANKIKPDEKKLVISFLKKNKRNIKDFTYDGKNFRFFSYEWRLFIFERSNNDVMENKIEYKDFQKFINSEDMFDIYHNILHSMLIHLWFDNKVILDKLLKDWSKQRLLLYERFLRKSEYRDKRKLKEWDWWTQYIEINLF